MKTENRTAMLAGLRPRPFSATTSASVAETEEVEEEIPVTITATATTGATLMIVGITTISRAKDTIVPEAADSHRLSAIRKETQTQARASASKHKITQRRAPNIR
jgi:hypothetical protein